MSAPPEAPPRRVYDTFLFSDELDLLEARLTELDDSVYRWVLVESPVNFRGDPKPLHYQENQDRFAPWKDRIIHVIADLEGCKDCWARENASRDAIKQGLGGLGYDDIFLLSDVDEIPMPHMIQESPGTIMMMRRHTLAVNLLDIGWWTGTLATFGSDSRYAIRKFLQRTDGSGRPFLANPIGFPRISGWHFSWLGGPDAIRAKVRSFGDEELLGVTITDEDADRVYRDRISPVEGGHLLELVIDDTFPKYMQDRRGPEEWYWRAAR